jgi:hypothetical protein
MASALAWVSSGVDLQPATNSPALTNTNAANIFKFSTFFTFPP